jgi:hypothetical protein
MITSSSVPARPAARNTPLIMIAEKAADMIRGRAPLAPVNV